MSEESTQTRQEQEQDPNHWRYKVAHPESRLGKSLDKKRGRQEIIATEQRKPWMRQPNETRVAYEAFCMFLITPEPRTYAKVARQLSKSEGLIQRWGARWSWQLRAAAYSEHVMMLHLESAEAERIRMFAEHRSLAREGIDLVRSHFATIRELIAANDGKADFIKPDTLVRLFAEAVKADKLTVEAMVATSEKSTEEAEALHQRYASELADLVKGLFDDLQLTPEQRELAKDALSKRLLIPGAE